MAKTEQELLQAILEARKIAAELDAKLSEAKKVKQEAEKALMEYMDNRELKSFKSAIYSCIVVRKELLRVSMDKEKKEEALRWIEEDCGGGDMIKPTIHNKTLNSFISARIKKGDLIPQELFKYFFQPELSITYGK